MTKAASAIPKASLRLAGWGRLDPVSCPTSRPETYAALAGAVVEREPGTCIARGLGRSYGDSAVNRGGAVVLTTRLDRILGFDADRGLVHAEAGVTFDDLLRVFLPRGWFPPVTPGTRHVTLGGAVAADVHGKNHHVDGALSSWLEDVELVTADGQTVWCSAGHRPEVFWGTLGGMGLTGVVRSVRLRMTRVATSMMRVTYRRARNLEELLDAFGRAEDRRRYSVAWIDCVARGERLGRSVLMDGEHAGVEDLPAERRAEPLASRERAKRSVPSFFPGFLLNRASVAAFNGLFYARHKDRTAVVDYDPYFYPLDAVRHWPRVYGKRGFIQYQALLPPASSRAGMRALLEAISEAGLASFLAVLKRMGAASPAPLGFPAPGDTLALDLPHRGDRLRRLVERLDAIVLEHGGRLYLAKDAMMSRATFERMYPRVGEFRELRRQLDPGGRFASDQARRLGLVEA